MVPATALTHVKQKPAAARVKLEFVMTRLKRLNDAPWNELQHERWAKLFE